jgi:hypothetical protein
MTLARSDVRHLAMRLALGFVLGYFGVQELRNPSDWTVFVPNFMAHRYPGQVEHLVLLHGFLLLTAAFAVGLGLCFLLGCLLATGMLIEVVFGLWIDGGGISDLVIRDIGLLGLAIGLLLDPVRTWHLDDLLLARIRRARQPKTRGKLRQAVPLPQNTVLALRVGSAGALVAGLLVLALVLRATGTSGAGPVNVGGLASARAQPSPTAAATPQPTVPQTAQAGSTPAPATSPSSANTGILFADWQYKRSSFQIYPGPIGSDAQTALSGFDVSVQDQGSTAVLTFKALSSRYHDATVTLDKGNSAYFVETSMRDDPNGQENELNDDGVVVVDPQGYILKS